MLLTFFQQKYWHIWDTNVRNFNVSLTNDIVSFEQPALIFYCILLYPRILLRHTCISSLYLPFNFCYLNLLVSQSRFSGTRKFRDTSSLGWTLSYRELTVRIGSNINRLRRAPMIVPSHMKRQKRLQSLLKLKKKTSRRWGQLFGVNHIALRTTKSLWSYGCSECNRVNCCLVNGRCWH